MYTMVLAAVLASFGQAAEEPDVTHHEVFYEEGRFAGWPANYGIWIWGDEILTGFSRGYYKDLGDRHHIDRERPEEYGLARSLDGGVTWTAEFPYKKGMLVGRGEALHGTEIPGVPLPPITECPGGIDFTHPDFAITFRMEDIDVGPARFSYSYDRGHNWEGPFRFPNLGTPGVPARTDYIVDGKHEMMVFMTAAKANRQEGRPFCARTTDGGGSWEFISYIGPEPDGFSIMPATVRLSDTKLVTVVRSREGDVRSLKAFASEDNGDTWHALPQPDTDLGVGNPPAMIQLEDGRLCLIYGIRRVPGQIVARLSSDEGQSWTDRIVLREGGTSTDIGYCRCVQRPDGKVVAVYYWTDVEHDPERYIAATIWDPPAPE